MKIAGQLFRAGLAAVILALGSVGCGDIVFKVSKKGKDSKGSDLQNEIEKDSEISIADVEAYLQDIDNLKEEAAQILIDQLRGDWRPQFRKAMRDFRDSVVRNATTEHSYRNDLFTALDQVNCTTLEKGDLTILEESSSLGMLLKGSLLAKLSKGSAASLNVGLPEKIDEITQILLFEMGMRIEGSSSIAEEGGTKTMVSEVILKIDSEIDETPEQTQNDNLALKLSFTRVTASGVDKSFELKAEVAPGLLDGEATAPVNFLHLKSSSEKLSNGGQKVTVEVKNGTGQNTIYSRQMMFSELGQDKNVYFLVDIARYGLSGEETRTATFDLGELQKCKSDPNAAPVDDGKGDSDCGKKKEGCDNSSGGGNPLDEEDPPPPADVPGGDNGGGNNGGGNNGGGNNGGGDGKDDDWQDPNPNDDNPAQNDPSQNAGKKKK